MVSATTPSMKKKRVTMSVRSVLWWHSEPWAPTWLCASSAWQVSRAWGAKWQPDKEGRCKGNSCWDTVILTRQCSEQQCTHNSPQLSLSQVKVPSGIQVWSKEGKNKQGSCPPCPELTAQTPPMTAPGPFSICHWGWPCLPAVPGEGELFYCQEPGLAMGRRTSG